MDNNQIVYLAYDGDNAGRLVGRAILSNNADDLHEVSARIKLGHEIVEKWAKEHGGQYISGGGDEGIFSIPPEALADIEHLRTDYHFATNLTMTVGIGNVLSEAGKALLVGKFRGKNMVVEYDPSIENDIKEAEQRVASGTASAEEQKISEAYLQPKGEPEKEADMKENPSHEEECPYCKDMSEEDSCPYCDEPQKEEDECPYCKDSDEEECPYCKESQQEESSNGVEPTAGPVVSEPTAQTSQDYKSKGLNDPGIPKPDIHDGNAPGLGYSALGDIDDQKNTNSNVMLDTQNEVHDHSPAPTNPDIHSQEAMKQIAEELEDSTLPQKSDRAESEQIDSADLPLTGETEENVSRPDKYNENTPADMGLAEDEASSQDPDLSGVLQEGLDYHADSIKKEKVVQMVSEALEGFRGCKDILEKAKEQAPQLYQSSIAMLRAMIEMAKMMGLEEAPEEQPKATAEEPAEPAVAQEDAAQKSPKDNKPIGKPIGKLPTKHTTPHVTRTTYSPGAVNVKGQKKVIDPVTGKTRWINMKEGKVQSPTGVPVKSPKQQNA